MPVKRRSKGAVRKPKETNVAEEKKVDAVFTRDKVVNLLVASASLAAARTSSEAYKLEKGELKERYSVSATFMISLAIALKATNFALNRYYSKDKELDNDVRKLKTKGPQTVGESFYEAGKMIVGSTVDAAKSLRDSSIGIAVNSGRATGEIVGGGINLTRRGVGDAMKYTGDLATAVLDDAKEGVRFTSAQFSAVSGMILAASSAALRAVREREEAEIDDAEYFDTIEPPRDAQKQTDDREDLEAQRAEVLAEKVAAEAKVARIMAKMAENEAAEREVQAEIDVLEAQNGGFELVDDAGRSTEVDAEGLRARIVELEDALRAEEKRGGDLEALFNDTLADLYKAADKEKSGVEDLKNVNRDLAERNAALQRKVKSLARGLISPDVSPDRPARGDASAAAAAPPDQGHWSPDVAGYPEAQAGQWGYSQGAIVVTNPITGLPEWVNVIGQNPDGSLIVQPASPVASGYHAPQAGFGGQVPVVAPQGGVADPHGGVPGPHGMHYSSTPSPNRASRISSPAQSLFDDGKDKGARS